MITTATAQAAADLKWVPIATPRSYLDSGNGRLVPTVCFAICRTASTPSRATTAIWIGMIVPRALRARYFAYKARFGYAATLAGLAGGGLLLERYTDQDRHLWPYAVLFFSAALGRLVRVGASLFGRRRRWWVSPTPWRFARW